MTSTAITTSEVVWSWHNHEIVLGLDEAGAEPLLVGARQAPADSPGTGTPNVCRISTMLSRSTTPVAISAAS